MIPRILNPASLAGMLPLGKHTRHTITIACMSLQHVVWIMITSSVDKWYAWREAAESTERAPSSDDGKIDSFACLSALDIRCFRQDFSRLLKFTEATATSGLLSCKAVLLHASALFGLKVL